MGTKGITDATRSLHSNSLHTQREASSASLEKSAARKLRTGLGSGAQAVSGPVAPKTGSLTPDRVGRVRPGQISQIGLEVPAGSSRPEAPANGAPPTPPRVMNGGNQVAHAHIDPYSDSVKQMQVRMKAAGIDPGPIDGLKGPLTRDGMRQYEAKFGKPASDGLGVDAAWAEYPATRPRQSSGDASMPAGTADIPQEADTNRPIATDGKMATLMNKKMTVGTAQDLQRMASAAQRDGVALTINSGHRDPNYQAKLFRQAVAKYGSVQVARKWVAPPGLSQHQTGQALDISMGESRVHSWLRKNAARFGFTQSYSWEPWHWFHKAG